MLMTVVPVDNFTKNYEDAGLVTFERTFKLFVVPKGIVNVLKEVI